ncbi:putative protein kinase IRE1 family [Helianthus anomalus]
MNRHIIVALHIVIAQGFILYHTLPAIFSRIRRPVLDTPVSDTPESNTPVLDTGERSIGKLVVSGKEIAKGSNGTVVFEGTYEGRNVAVKRLVKAHHDVASKEIQNLLVSDQHPNIVHYYGCEYDRDFVYLSLERCDCSLYDLIMYSKSFQPCRPNGYPSSDLLKLMRDIVVGLVHLHDLGIIHRDLKPHNVLIVKGKRLSCKLSDMGISKRLVADVSSLGPHATGSGSSGWQAPEQLCHGRQTRAMDMFSFALLVSFSFASLMASIRLDIPEAVNLIIKLLDPIPEHRPKASEVLHHPLFWNSDMRMSFLRETSDRVNSENRKVSIVRVLENKGRVVFGRNWDDKMEPAFISYMGDSKHRKYNYKRVRCLLRVIRNSLNHYRDLPKEIQVRFTQHLN